MVYNLWVYVYWFVYKTHFRHTVALALENVAVKGLNMMLLNSKNIKGLITCVIVWLHLITSALP